jgi:hypothetical protein
VEVGTPGRAEGAAFAQVRAGEALVGRHYRAGTVGSDGFTRHPAGGVRSGGWGRAALRIRGGQIALSLNGRPVAPVRGAAPPAGPVTFRAAEGLGLRNVFVRAIKP